MSRSYYVSHNMRHGFWIVCCNDSGHYRDVAKYVRREAAVKAAEQLNDQRQGQSAHAITTLAIGAL